MKVLLYLAQSRKEKQFWDKPLQESVRNAKVLLEEAVKHVLREVLRYETYAE